MNLSTFESKPMLAYLALGGMGSAQGTSFGFRGSELNTLYGVFELWVGEQNPSLMGLTRLASLSPGLAISNGDVKSEC